MWGSLPMAGKRKRSIDLRRISNGSSFAECPACQITVISCLINTHLDWDCKVLNAATSKTGISRNPLETTSNNVAGIQFDSCKEVENMSFDVQGREPYIKRRDGSSAQDRSLICPRLVLGDNKKQYVSSLATDPEVNVVKDFLASGIKEQNRSALDHRGSYLNVHNEFDTKPCFDTTMSKIESPDKFSAHEIVITEVHDQWLFPDRNDLTPVLFEAKTEIPVGSAQEHEDSETLSGSSNLELNDNGGTSNMFHWSGTTQNTRAEDRRKLDVKISDSSSRKPMNCAWSFITASEPLTAPKGHHVIENFISEEEEKLLLSFLDMDLENPWRSSSFSGLNMTKCYGIRIDLRRRCAQPEIFKIPGIVLPILERLRASVPCLKDFWPDETNAIDYHKHDGHWLRPHVDDRQLSSGIIVNFSLCGDCKMTYAREKGPQGSFKVMLKRRCVQIQTGECRYSFTHSILNEDLLSPRRVSMTFRQTILH